MNNGEYWRKRIEENQGKIFRETDEYLKELEGKFRSAEKEIEKEIALWYSRFAEDNGISMSEARRVLDKKELAELKWDVKEYIKKGSENGITADWDKELRNASKRVRITRLEAVRLQIRNHIENLYGGLENNAKRLTGNVYKESFNRSGFEMAMGTGIDVRLAGINEEMLEKVIKKPWSVDGTNFSERLWKNKELLINTVEDEIIRGILTDKTPDEISKRIAEKMGGKKKIVKKNGKKAVEKYYGMLGNARRIVMTETAYFSTLGQRDCFKELGREKYEILGTLDTDTCEGCGELDGRVYDMEDFRIGVTAPPFHPFCRCAIVPVVEGWEDSERIARNEEGENEYVRGDMTYEEWKGRFVGKKGLSAKVGGNGVPLHEEAAFLGKINLENEIEIEKALTDFEKYAIYEDIETALIITSDGEIYKCFGSSRSVYPDYDLGDKLRGAIVSHNHPIDETEYSFSNDDISLFFDYKLKRLRGCDKKFTYELTRNPNDIDVPPKNWRTFENYRHSYVIYKAEKDGFGYRRWKNDTGGS